MKKLFNTGSHIIIDEFSTLRINGPYALKILGPDYAKINTGAYNIEASGEELLVDLLSEEVAIFSFDTIEKLTITKNDKAERSYEG